MVFSSIPAYLDPSNWQQQQNHQIIGSSSGSANPLQVAGGPHPPPLHTHGGPGGRFDPARVDGRAGPAREHTHARNRPEMPSLRVDQHKSAAAAGGTKGPSPPPAPSLRRAADRTQTNNDNNNNINPSSTSSIDPTNGGGSAGAANMLGLPPLRFMSPLAHQLTESFAGDHMGLGNYSGITAPAAEMGFHGGDGGGGNIEPWRLQQQAQQFPVLGWFGPIGGGDLPVSTAASRVSWPADRRATTIIIIIIRP
ncbi:dof zinc finger protein dof2.4 [Phtheirospermum japonicum]|uniref:Dof zinc finger protein dof2.4 n=1 Tax=Phtheirospermum japonicum TaxID=374723 RepID=A0A830D388_9LAMI|nr:dof zinc finger protein dof2.4 [Phtheirospermum japonicum]